MRKLIGAVAILTVLAAPAVAQEWPTKQVNLIVPFSAGGTTDLFGRLLAQHMHQKFGQPFIVENRPGASGAIAAELSKRASPDGYTLFVAPLPVMAVVPAVSNVRYDPQKDFAPISNIATNPFALVVNNDIPVKTLSEFVDYVRTNNRRLSYGSAGVGSLNHLSMALFLKRAGLEMIHVPYKGNAPALTDVMAGHIAAMFSNLPDALAQAKGGTVRLLAISSEARSPLVPDVPTVSESGYPNFNVLTWNGLMAPAETPKPVIDRIAAEIAAAVKDPAFSARLREFGADPLGDTPDDYRAMLARDVATWAQAVDVAGAKQQ